MEKKEMSVKNKALFIASTVGVVIAVVLLGLQSLNIWPAAHHLYLPIAGLALLAQAEVNKENNSSISTFCMVGALVIFALLMLNLIL